MERTSEASRIPRMKGEPRQRAEDDGGCRPCPDGLRVGGERSWSVCLPLGSLKSAGWRRLGIMGAHDSA